MESSKEQREFEDLMENDSSDDPFKSSIISDVLMLNVWDKVEDGLFLYVLRKFPSSS